VGVLANNISLHRPIYACVTLLLGYSAMRYAPDSGICIYPRSCFDITLDNKMHADQYWCQPCLRENKCDAILVIACTVNYTESQVPQGLPWQQTLRALDTVATRRLSCTSSSRFYVYSVIILPFPVTAWSKA